MAHAPVLFERDDAVGVITLNRPDNRNSMTPELLDEFARVVAQARTIHELRCVVITGTGHCFSAGADFKSEIQRQSQDRLQLPYERSFAMYEPFLSILDLEVPVIAAMNGHAVGGGFGLSLLCDLRIANCDAKYGANFVRLGLSSGLAISYCLPRLIGIARASELLFTGRLIPGHEAERIGLVNAALPQDQVMLHAMSLAREIAANAPIAVRMAKRSIYDGLDWRPRHAALHEASWQAATIDTQDAREGIAALLEKRKPAFKGE